MRIYLGSDHRGFPIKEKVREWLASEGYEVDDIGDRTFDPEDDYVDFAIKVAEIIEGNGDNPRGILFCGSGHGMDMVANRFPHVRAIVGYNDEVTIQGRTDENANILVIPADWVKPKSAIERVRLFLETEAGQEPRYLRRLEKLKELHIRSSSHAE